MLAPFLLTLALLAPQEAEHIVAFQVHGNTLTAEDEVLRIAGLEIGMPVSIHTFDEVASRLRSSRKFERVDVLKRFASIADPLQIVCVIVVDEGRVEIDWGEKEGAAGVLAPVRKVRAFGLMFMPVLDFEDGYGFSYGVRSALPEPAGSGSVLSFPTTWGGEKRAGVDFEKAWSNPVVSRVRAAGAIARRRHPFYDENIDRRVVLARVEKDVWRSLRLGATTGWEHVSFLGVRDQFTRVGVDAVLDTRIDPMLARNAVYARVSWERLNFVSSPDANRTDIELRGYVGLGQSVVVVRALRQDADRSLPPYLSPILGGTANLRGFKTGAAVGDSLASGSLELRMPLTSPLDVGRLGVSAFVDAAAVYDEGAQLRRQRFNRGFGGGLWLSAAIIRLNFYLAHGEGRSTRAHFATTVLF